METLNVQYLKDMFNKYNPIYFGGILEMPKFVIDKSKKYAGLFTARNIFSANPEITITISNLGVLTEEDVINILLHEMIHYFLFKTNQKDNNSHGFKFQKCMNHINKFGHKIDVKNKNNSEELVEKNKEGFKKFLIMSLFDTNKNKYIVCRLNEKKLSFFQFFAKMIISSEKNMTEVKFYTSYDKIFEIYTVCNKRIVGNSFTKEQLDKLNLVEIETL